MKKLFALFALCGIALTLTGCGNKDTDDANVEAENVNVEADSATVVADDDAS